MLREEGNEESWPWERWQRRQCLPHDVPCPAGSRKERQVYSKAVKKLFEKIAPAMKDRKGGYTRIVKLGTRKGDGAEMCVLQYVCAAEAAAPAAEEESAKEVK